MEEKRNKTTLYDELGPHALLSNAKATCISGLYLCYCELFNKRNADLYKSAYQICSKDDLARNTLQLIKTKTKSFDKKSFADNALDFATRNFLDYGFLNSNPHLSELITNLLKIQKSEIVCDFGSGSGSFLGFVAKNMDDPFFRHDLIGYEINSDSCILSKMVLEMCGAKYIIQNLDYLTCQKVAPFDKGYVFPPFGIRYVRNATKLSKESAVLINSRTSIEWLFVLKALENMKQSGKLVALLPEHTLFKASDSEVRHYLLEKGLIEGIISLPSNSFPNNNTKLALVVLSNNNKEFKYIDGEELLKDLPIKGLNSKEASRDIQVAYDSNKVEKYQISNVEIVHFNLAHNAIIKNIEDNDLPELDKVAEVYRGCAMTLSNFKGDIVESKSSYQILTSSDIDENGSIDFEKLTYIGGDKKLDKHALEEGDVVLTSKSTKVKVAVIKDKPDRKIIVTGGMIVVRPHKGELNGTYLKLYLDSEKGRQQLSMIQKGTVIVTISFENFQKIKLDLPKIKEQEAFEKEYDYHSKLLKKKKEELKQIEEAFANFINENIK